MSACVPRALPPSIAVRYHRAPFNSYLHAWCGIMQRCICCSPDIFNRLAPFNALTPSGLQTSHAIAPKSTKAQGSIVRFLMKSQSVAPVCAIQHPCLPGLQASYFTPPIASKPDASSMGFLIREGQPQLPHAQFNTATSKASKPRILQLQQLPCFRNRAWGLNQHSAHTHEPPHEKNSTANAVACE